MISHGPKWVTFCSPTAKQSSLQTGMIIWVPRGPNLRVSCLPQHPASWSTQLYPVPATAGTLDSKNWDQGPAPHKGNGVQDEVVQGRSLTTCHTGRVSCVILLPNQVWLHFSTLCLCLCSGGGRGRDRIDMWGRFGLTCAE